MFDVVKIDQMRMGGNQIVGVSQEELYVAKGLCVLPWVLQVLPVPVRIGYLTPLSGDIPCWSYELVSEFWVEISLFIKCFNLRISFFAGYPRFLSKNDVFDSKVRNVYLPENLNVTLYPKEFGSKTCMWMLMAISCVAGYPSCDIFPLSTFIAPGCLGGGPGRPGGILFESGLPVSDDSPTWR